MKIKLWGVRGSIPCPGPETKKYGGNTACLEVRFEGVNRRIIIDAGSGIRELGNSLMAETRTQGPIKADLILTHTHWDHIMGFPFFTPIYIPTTRLKIYGPTTYEEESLEDIVGGQLSYRYFPVRRTELTSNIEYHHLKEGDYDFGDGISVTTKYLNHPVLCLGYRIEHRGKVFCTAYDTEPFQNLFSTDPDDPGYDEAMAQEGQAVALEENRRVEQFFHGADLLVHDSQYTQVEYETNRVGWGHSSFELATSAAKRAQIKKMALFHHDPERTDDQLDQLAEIYCSDGSDGGPVIFMAKEKMEITI